ncbi:MAG: fasciclin domain-containing protein [Pseudomonadota bacterium]
MDVKFVLLATGCAILAACGGAPEGAGEVVEEADLEASPQAVADDVEISMTLRDVLESDERFSTLVAALDASDLLVTLEEEGPLTIFAPNNAAFESLPSGVSLEVLTAEANKAILRDLLAYHVLSAEVPSYDIEGRSFDATAVNGDPLQIDGTGPVISVSGAAVVLPDLQAENGVIHVIDTVLLPPAN